MRLSIVIPTYRREQVLLETVRFLRGLKPPADEILVIDQSEEHRASTIDVLGTWNREGSIRWIQLERPSITHAMNVGLERAHGDIVVFVDDDIIPDARLLSAHALAHAEGTCSIVAGQVLQPGEAVLDDPAVDDLFQFRSGRRRLIEDLMGGNFSVRREVALALGGFDENFVHVAYNFELEFCDRALSAGNCILFEPNASIRHLKAVEGGTRSYGHHLTTTRPSHAVGAYYYLLRARRVRRRISRILTRLFRSVSTRHHLLRPWWIPGTLLAELLGLTWALRLFLGGPRLIDGPARIRSRHD